MLTSLAKVLVRVVGSAGLTFRVGGDEFAVLFEDTPVEAQIIDLCKSLIAEFAKPLSFAGEDCTVGVSIGYAFGDGPPRNPSEVFVNADAALYAAKYAGRSSFKAYAQGVGAQVKCVSNSRQEMLNAIKDNKLICYYQPQYDARTLEVIGAEALVRWNCPQRGILTPDAFLPQASRIGLLSEIDAAVFAIVADQQTDWAMDSVNFPTVSVNTSAARLGDDALVDNVRNTLMPHHRMSLELLETAFLDRVDDDLAAKLDALRGLGIRIELDDFGSGHSSVAALQSIKPDRVKIGRSLVAPLKSNSSQILTLQSLARLETADIVIEGLETGIQLAAIRGVDCDALQGYALQRPMQADDFAALLMRHDKTRAQRRA